MFYLYKTTSAYTCQSRRLCSRFTSQSIILEKNYPVDLWGAPLFQFVTAYLNTGRRHDVPQTPLFSILHITQRKSQNGRLVVVLCFRPTLLHFPPSPVFQQTLVEQWKITICSVEKRKTPIVWLLTTLASGREGRSCRRHSHHENVEEKLSSVASE